ncbi:MAG TPA: nicotinate-nucleotide adenylyltransferase [Casimicrobiaceae bacterium]|nr:nicotinate-nucleotide adenylyltransferase [Casimicrobiaceae bacterium]
MTETRPASLDPPLAILGGTFDPVHYGHLRLAQDVRQALDLDEVRLVPAADPPHRGKPRASTHDRIAMLDLAAHDFPGIVVDTREVRREGKSYTVDTLSEIRAEKPRTPLLLLVGADTFRGLPSWHRWLALFDLAHLVVAPRPGVALDAGLSPSLEAQWRSRRIDDARGLRSRIAGAIYLQPVAPQPISSTAIRAAIARGDAKSVEFAGLLPPAVFAYIESHGLYRHPPHAR